MGWSAEQVLPVLPRRLGRRLAHPSREERAEWLQSHVAPHEGEPEHTVHQLGPADAHLAKTTWHSRWARTVSPTAVEHRLLGLGAIIVPPGGERVIELTLAPPFGLVLVIAPGSGEIKCFGATNDKLSDVAHEALAGALGVDLVGLECKKRTLRIYPERPLEPRSLMQLHPTLTHRDGEFDGVTLKLPQWPDTSLQVFRTSMSLIGATTPLLMATRGPVLVRYALDAMLPPPNHRRPRPDDEEDEEEPAKRRRGEI